MHRRPHTFALSVALVVSVLTAASCRHATPRSAGADLVVRVAVHAVASAEALGRAEVELYDEASHRVAAGATTDTAGRARLLAPRGRRYQLRVRRLAYIAVSQALPTAEGCVDAVARLERDPCDLVPSCPHPPSRVTFDTCRPET